MKPPKVILTLAIAFLQLIAVAHQPEKASQLKFIKNLGQQHANVLYSAELSGGAVYLEHSTLTYIFYNADDLSRIDKYIHDCEYLKTKNNESPLLRGHAYKVHLQGANINAAITGQEKFAAYYNYFLGQDAGNRAGHVPLFGEVLYQDLYNGVDLNVYSEAGNAKYDFIVKAGANASNIVLNFEGTDGLSIQDGNLKIKTSVATIVEQKPYAFQMIEGEKREVKCRYQLNGNNVKFHFPNGYDGNYELVIDPVIIASTYSGETYRSYAHSATYDDAGNIYSSGRAFSTNVNGSGSGYPATVGAFQTTHAGGFQDICVSKYNPDGSALIWATYIGGSGQEQPHSLVVDANQQLYIYGSSNSGNYPVTANAYQKINAKDNFNNQLADIVVTKLNAAGSALLGSTYIGGRSENDGIAVSNIQRYYGDHFKGEIIIDSPGNAYIASYAQSTDFPTTTGVVQPAFYGGGQDGVVFKLNSDMSNLEWSTFLGGPLDDACYGLKLDANGDLFVTGAISSNVLTNTAGTIHTAYIGGLFDAFVAHIRADGKAMLKSTYFGSVNEEQAYLIDLDKAGNVYLFGATPNPSIQPTPGAYQGVIGGSFVAKIKPALDSVLFIATFNQLAPTALMVDDCNYIYIAGHGGLNTSAGTLTGFATTPDAFKTGSGGFYLMTLEPNATALKFGSYYGPPKSHVDGGTCRFNKKGVMYHALCTDSPSLFTTATAYRKTKQAFDFDNTVFKVDFQPVALNAEAKATIAGTNDSSVNINTCLQPSTVQFVNNSQNATQYTWYFGNGDSSLLSQPSYTYTDTGTYNVKLVARNIGACNQSDTAYLTVNIHPLLINVSVQQGTGCTNGSATVNVVNPAGSFTYLWSNTAATQTISNIATGTYTVTVTGAGNCSASATASVASSNGIGMFLSPQNTTCGNNNGTISATINNGIAPFTYIWSNGATDSTINTLAPGTYTVTVNAGNGCSATVSTNVGASAGASVSVAGNKSVMCSGDSAYICADTVFSSYVWNTGETTRCIYTKLGGNYRVSVSDNVSCTAVSNNIGINVYPLPPISITVNGDTLRAFNAVTYQWYLNGVLIPNATSDIYLVQQTGDYSLVVTDTNGCHATSNKVNVVHTGITDLLQDAGLRIYPNPFAEGFELGITNYNFKQPLTAEIFDVRGRKVAEQKITTALTQFDLTPLAKGIYILKVEGKAFLQTRKIVKD